MNLFLFGSKMMTSITKVFVPGDCRPNEITTRGNRLVDKLYNAKTNDIDVIRDPLSWVDWPGRAEPSQAAKLFKLLCAGADPGRAEDIKKCDGPGPVAAHAIKVKMVRVGLRPMRFGLGMRCSALPMRWFTCVYGLARATVHDLWCPPFLLVRCPPVLIGC